MSDGVTSAGLSIVCEACECALDFNDDFTDIGICRQCGIAFLVDPPSVAATQAS
jgi:hypothetical protein